MVLTNGTAIRLRRKELGMNVGELARAARMNASYLSAIELGRVQGAPRTITRIAAALNMPSRELFEVVERVPLAA
jgi:transcriptional regulator with XRE-family HTH domain